jgi:hypothetical protein
VPKTKKDADVLCGPSSDLHGDALDTITAGAAEEKADTHKAEQPVASHFLFHLLTIDPDRPVFLSRFFRL